MNGSLAAVAHAQGGPFRAGQAFAAGYSRRDLSRFVRSGAWTRLRRGVYVESRRLDGERAYGARAAGVVLALGEGAVCSHESAALLHGIALLDRPSDGVRVTRPGARGGTRLDGVQVFRAELPARHVGRVHGVPVTTAARTAIDLARAMPYAAGVVTLDAARYHSRVSRAELESVLCDCAGWPGAAAAAEAVAASRPRVRSPLETLGRLMCAAAGLPEPETGILIGAGGEPYTEADLYWQDQRVIVLLDGMFKYDVSGRLRAEKLKQERLERDGFIVVRLNWQDVTEDAARSVTRIRGALQRGARHARGAASNKLGEGIS